MSVDGFRSIHVDESPERHFRTEDLRTNLKARTVSSGVVASVSQVGLFVLNLCAIMVLARILAPRDFGLVAMIFTVMAFLRVFRDAGLAAATVQREGITHAQVSNLFWANVVLSALATLVMAASAPLISRFYGESVLTPMTLALATSFVLSGLGAQHLAIMNRQMRFKAVAVIQMSSAGAGTLVGTVMAWWQFGPWALVGMHVSTSIVSLLLTWNASAWRPQWVSRDPEMKSLLMFGANVTLSSFLYSLARGADSLLIGKYYGSDSLGVYSRASALLVRPVEHLTMPINEVLVPALSRLQVEPERYRRTFLKAHDAIALGGFVFIGLFFPLARPLILVVLGPQWEYGAAIFAAMTIAALFVPLSGAASLLFISQGRGSESLFASSVVSSVTVGSFVVGMPFGAQAVAVSYAVFGSLVVLPFMYRMAGVRGPVGVKDLWRSCLRHLPVGVVVFAATSLGAASVAFLHPITQMLICVPGGMVIGAGFVCVYGPARRTVGSLVSMMRLDAMTADLPAFMRSLRDVGP